MKTLFLIKDPEIDSVDMQTLVGIAHAIEQESVRRYARLADHMERQGEAANAAAFRVLLEEERKHVDAVAHWAGKLGQSVPAAEAHAWQLPQDLSTSWDDIAGSALLTPYRAFALAVENEQRAFSFYTYLAARAQDERVMAEAEKLAVEELHHAALLRRFRRRAWHRERHAAREPDTVVTSVQQLQRLVATREAAIRACHQELEARLRSIGDEASARLLEELSRPSHRLATTTALGGSPDARALAGPADSEPSDQDAVQLLVQAQRPLETFSETLEGVMRTTEGELFSHAEAAMVDVVKRLARISLQTAQRMHEMKHPAAQAAPPA